MKLDFATLAFGYSIRVGGATPNWATSLGQGAGYKINPSDEVNELLKGMVYRSVPLKKVSTKIGKGGKQVMGSDDESPIQLAALFEKVYVNDTLIENGSFILLITKDTSKSHFGRLRLKYGPSNSFITETKSFSNEIFFEKMRKQLSLADDACFFVSDIKIVNQDTLVLKTFIVNQYSSVTYEDSNELHSAWSKLSDFEVELPEKEEIDEIPEERIIQEAEHDKYLCNFDANTQTDLFNLIIYGTPGCGKSWYVKNELLKDYKIENVIRTTFYQDYTNTDFVGQIMPIVNGEDVTYKFNPGPFTLALRRAVEAPNEPVALVIEELNRGNAPSIFGDIFQLLDRENGKSEYQITNVNIQKYLSDNIPDMEFNCIMLPANLSIIATMNTSDQNVFTLDTAFKRRWEFKKLKNKFKADHPYKGLFVPGMENTTWEMFVDDINKFIEDSSDLQSEDKQLGVFFVSEDLLCEDASNVTDELKEKFAYKVLEYLWDDVAKFERDNWFNSNIKSLDKLVEEYVKSGREVFKDGIFRKHTS